jgi:hypothetical protein
VELGQENTDVAIPSCSPAGRELGHFGIDFAPLSAQKWRKTAKKGPKSAFSCYLSVTYVLLYAVHSFILTRFL